MPAFPKRVSRGNRRLVTAGGKTAVMARERGKPRSPMPSKVPSGIGGLGTMDTRGRTGMTSGGVRMTNAKNAYAKRY